MTFIVFPPLADRVEQAVGRGEAEPRAQAKGQRDPSKGAHARGAAK